MKLLQDIATLPVAIFLTLLAFATLARQTIHVGLLLLPVKMSGVSPTTAEEEEEEADDEGRSRQNWK